MKSETMPNGKIQVSANLQLYFRRSTRTASTQLLSGHLARLVGTLQSTLRYVYELLEDKKSKFQAIAVSNVLPKLLESYMSCESSEDLQTKSKTALKKILEKCVYLPALEPLLHDAPSNILQHVVAQYREVSNPE